MIKRIEELGISTRPWDFQPNHPYGCRVASALNWNVTTAEPANARLIAAAPELYVCLREAVIEMCHDCPSCGGSEKGYRCDAASGECFVQKWRAALDEASGEEAK